MMEIMYQRRSIRKYQDTPIEKEKVEQLVKSALLAPSSRSLYPHSFLVVDDRNLIDKLALAKEHGALSLKEAPLAFVILADETVSDVWVEDSSIAASYVQLAATSLGLGSCWIQIRNRQHDRSTAAEQYTKQILNIPEGMKVECILSLGYPAETKPPHSDQELKWENVYLNTYQNPYKK